MLLCGSALYVHFQMFCTILFAQCKALNCVLISLKTSSILPKASTSYEREVISVPAGTSYPFVRCYDIYACPDSDRWATYKSARYMAFRRKGGGMEVLYGVETVLRLDPHRPDWRRVPQAYKERVRGYIKDRKASNMGFYGGGAFKFYILSQDDQIKLQPELRVEGFPRGHVYLRYHDATSGRSFIPVASKSGEPSIRELVALSETEDEEDLDLKSLNDDQRERVVRSLVWRRGRLKFRQKLLEAYNNRCAITGCTVEDLLEAAHIKRYMGQQSDKVQNGLLLRADIHTLFDLGLIAMDSDSMVVVVSPSLQGTEYAALSGQPLRLPQQTKEHPSKKALSEHRQKAKL